MENVLKGKFSYGKCSNFAREILENVLKKMFQLKIVLTENYLIEKGLIEIHLKENALT